MTQWPPLSDLNNLENEVQKFIHSFLILKNVVEKLEDGPITASSFEITFFSLLKSVKRLHDFVQMGHTCKICEEDANSSQLILSQILVEMKRNCESGDLLI